MRPALAALAALAALVTAAPASAERSSLYDLVDAAAQRLQTADPVAAAKWVNGGPITDRARAEQVLATIASESESAGIPSDFARRVFTDQINANEAIQYTRFAGWKLDPATAPGWAPDLSASRQTIDALNEQIVSGIAEQLPLLRSDDCPVLLESARAGVAGTRQLDDLYRRALDSATISYCTA